jgi:hypothetical protein
MDIMDMVGSPGHFTDMIASVPPLLEEAFLRALTRPVIWLS